MQGAEDVLKKKDLLVVAGALALALGLMLAVRLGLANPRWQPQKAQQQATGITVTLTGTQKGGTEGTQTLYPLQPGAKRYPADAYLVINVNNYVFEPVPFAGDYIVTITQENGKQNVADISADAAGMRVSTCPGQECIHQGKVSLGNRNQRVLYNQIICLPNTVILSVLDEGEARLLYGEKP